jgi:hypothetical protein
MPEADQYRANLTACRRMADKSQDEREKRAWLDMAESWRLLMITAVGRLAGEQFDAAWGFPAEDHPRHSWRA